ncbi:hypothetical protein L6164_001698 [Bauhinia variegata]|uniref:Uncharacterized protein n=1 Tax=Bauhinia variegata TaxID=167791 RepID=A0ACB9QAH6_BAUVA|nr:hypothetical protein L6164_001698 [Bauhinia variegata]
MEGKLLSNACTSRRVEQFMNATEILSLIFFWCLQWNKELRPSMDEVLEVLKTSESGKDESEHEEETDVDSAGILDDKDYWQDSLSSCSKIQLPIQHPHDTTLFQDPNYDLFEVLTSRLFIEVETPEECLPCNETNDICLYNNGTFSCATSAAAKEKRWIWKVIVGSVIAGALGMIIIALVIYRRRATSSAFKYQSRNISGHPHSNGDLECSGMFFGIPVFSYKELEEATNNFDHARELGDGGFGIVYYGKLRDGREVAVKRLYEHNYKRVQQFVTEIEILTRLRHRNLVTLYGCTSLDITRIRDEINLANLALKKIRNSALSELVDPSLGFESDDEVRRMIVSVAELAFQCLQMDRELRPSMGQVLSELERIENGTHELEHLEEEDLHEIQISNSKVHLPPSLSPENDEVGSLKNLKTPRLHQTD